MEMRAGMDARTRHLALGDDAAQQAAKAARLRHAQPSNLDKTLWDSAWRDAVATANLIAELGRRDRRGHA